MCCVKWMGMKMNKITGYLSIALLSISSQYVYAECTAYSTPAIIGPVSSFNVPNLAKQQMSGGLACVGSLSAFSRSYIKYRAIYAPMELTHENGVDTAHITIRDSSESIVQSGLEKDLSSFSILSIFGGPNSSIPFTVQVAESLSLKPGVYIGTLYIKWFYYVPALGIGGINLTAFQSDGITFDWWGNVTNWGSGRDATVPIKLIVTEDCRISTQNIDFGSAALVSKFDTVNGYVRITCSAKTPYSVGLSNGQYFNNTRRMKHQSKNTYIGYEVYKNWSPQRWGSVGSERWNSVDASLMPGIHDGKTSQTYSFTSKIVEPSTTIAPEGVYTDTVQVEVKF